MLEVMGTKNGEPAIACVAYSDTMSPRRLAAVAWNELTMQLYSDTEF